MKLKIDNYVEIDNTIGGRQFWWGKESIGNQFGCGVIVGLDSLIYNKVIAVPLSKDVYIEQATMLWSFIRPNTGFGPRMPYVKSNKKIGFGVYSQRKFVNGLKQYLKLEGLSLNVFRTKNARSKKSYHHFLEFVKEALLKEHPVYILIHKDQRGPYSFHWITILGLSIEGDKVSAEMATWGKTYVIEDLEVFWRKKGILDNKYALHYAIVK